MPKPFKKKVSSVNDELSVAVPDMVGRSLPNSLEAERGLIACCLLDPAEIISRCQAQKLPSEAFFQSANKTIFEVCINTFEEKNILDITVLAEELNTVGKLHEVGGPVYLTDIAARIETTAHANYFIDVVREKYLLRRLIHTATKTVQKCYEPQQDGGLENFIDEIEKEIFAIGDDRLEDSTKPLRQSVDEAVKLVQKLLAGKGQTSGMSYGLTDLDKMTHGLHPQEMVILAARPSMGKTSLALNVADSVAMPESGEKRGVLVFSLEMGHEQLAMRLLTGRARVSSQRLREGFVNKEEQQRLAVAAKELKDAKIFIDDSSQVTINQLRAISRRIFARNEGMSLIVVDYLQLISGSDPKMQREQQIAEISRGLKGIAKELNVPVIVLSQLNRDSEKEKRKPKLSDLRESGSIEQDADLVLLLARPDDAGDDHSTAADSADLIIAKQRNGAVGDIRLNFIKEITRFEDYTE